MILPMNYVPWKTYYRRNLRKDVGSSPTQPALVQDSEPLSEKTILENIGEQNNVDTEVVSDREDSDGGNSYGE
ncbi:E3 ubiquitin-protein ligase PRT1 isoform X2 [Cucumis melo var. makuwa]|uniref:E3 ubiquitin-protein ligase PRT1 isoform X2 n=1 Tax=Cucumis melo var. makuwa TaxID=1194695 RepID=A0A5D3DQE1_CUCMM|nr:E3 ubiquitin-protein ligase PRT1 isoform X2 [Cucumis melo var. makuwa]